MCVFILTFKKLRRSTKYIRSDLRKYDSKYYMIVCYSKLTNASSFVSFDEHRRMI